MSALFQNRRNFAVNCSVKTKLDAYTGSLVPIVIYDSQSWCPNKQNLHECPQNGNQMDLDNKCCIQRQTPRAQFTPPLSLHRNARLTFRTGAPQKLV